MISAVALPHVFHEPWLEKMLEELGKLAQKVGYLGKMDIFQSQFTH